MPNPSPSLALPTIAAKGMNSFDKNLKRLLKAGVISQETYDTYEGM